MWPFKKKEPDYEQVYENMRQLAFNVTAEDLGLAIGPNQPIGVIVEFGMAGTIVTLAAFADGAVSMYIKGGPVMIGAGEREAPRKAGLALVEVASKLVGEMAETDSFPLPEGSSMRFYARVPGRILTHEESVEELMAEGNHFGPLFLAANNLLTQIRILSEGK